MKRNIIFILLISFITAGWFTFGSKNKQKTQYTTVTCATAPSLTYQDWEKSDFKAPLFDGLDVLEYPVSTQNELAQKYFNQGMVLAYAFNHAEAARSFRYAAKLDTSLAMAYWGYAYVMGPNYNSGMESDNYESVYNAIQKAQQLSAQNSTEKEKALIKALAKRYVEKPVEDRSKIETAYAMAMKSVYENFPDDADIGTLYAEALMILHPWDLFDNKRNMKSWTNEIITILEQIIKDNPNHPGAHHYYIHAVESSNEPERGLKSARLFDEGLVPTAGHLLHMPAHIYIRTGDYHSGSQANFRAIEADESYISSCNAQGLYPLAYFPHNYHFLAATATLEGNSKWGIEAAIKVAENADKQMMKEPGWGTLQHYYTIPYYVYVKFGKWNEILQLKNDDSSLPYLEAVRAYARGMAFLGLKNTDRAKEELSALNKLANDPAIKDITIWDLNDAVDLVEIAQLVLEAEIRASEGKFDQSISLLHEAVEKEDNLNYNEPPDWFFSVRHHLGAVQVEAGRFKDAIDTFEDDLRIFPKNGWALHGMKQAYHQLSDTTNEERINERLKTVWAHADIELPNARLK